MQRILRALAYFSSYFKELWQRRGLVFTLAYAELQQTIIRYPLSYFWWILEPLLTMLCYVFLVTVLGRAGPRQGVPFFLFVFIGILPWYWTISCVMGGLRLITQYAQPISQIRFPNFVLVLAKFSHETVLYIIGHVVLLATLFAYGHWPSQLWIYWPILFILQSLLILTLMSFFAAMAIFLPDLEKLLPFILRLWFYGSPILWDLGQLLPKLSASAQKIVLMNPMATLIGAYRQILVFQEVPSMENIIHWIVIMTITFGLSMLFFIVKEKHFSRYL